MLVAVLVIVAHFRLGEVWSKRAEERLCFDRKMRIAGCVRLRLLNEPDKFGVAGFTAVGSEAVAPPRVRECPVQMEGIVHDFRPFGKNVSANMFEVHIVKLHVEEKLLLGDGPLASADHELLSILWGRRRGVSVAAGGIRFHEIRDPRSGGATGEFVWHTRTEIIGIAGPDDLRNFPVSVAMRGIGHLYPCSFIPSWIT
jgi:hypothetical protein